MPKLRTPIRAIREKCLDCTCDQIKEIRECPTTECSLWPYRMAKRPSKLTIEAYESQDGNTIQASIEGLSGKAGAD